MNGHADGADSDRCTGRREMRSKGGEGIGKETCQRGRAEGMVVKGIMLEDGVLRYFDVSADKENEGLVACCNLIKVRLVSKQENFWSNKCCSCWSQRS